MDSTLTTLFRQEMPASTGTLWREVHQPAWREERQLGGSLGAVGQLSGCGIAEDQG